MVKSTLGYIDIGYERWFITKCEIVHGTFEDYAVLSAYLPRSINNPKTITKQIRIKSNEMMWGIIETFQAKYPHATFWKTAKQREKLKYGR